MLGSGSSSVRSPDAPVDAAGTAVWVNRTGMSWSTILVAAAPIFAGVWILSTVWLTGTQAFFSQGIYPLLLALIWVGWFWPLILHLVWEEPRAIRIAPGGVTLRFVGRTIDVPWWFLTPDALRVGRRGLRVRYCLPNGRRARIPIALTPAQGSALLRSPYAPDWGGAGHALEKLGVRSPGPR